MNIECQTTLMLRFIFLDWFERIRKKNNQGPIAADYHINCGVIQGFLALTKVMCWYSQSAADTSLVFGATRSGWWINGRAFTILITSRLSELSRIMTAKTLKNPYRWQTVSSDSSQKGKGTNLLTGKLKVTYSVALVLAFLSAANENRQLEDLPLADFGHLPERLLLSVRTNSIDENFLYWKLRPLLFL